MDNQLERSIDALFCRWQEPGSPGGQVLLRKNGEVIYDKCFGNANIEHGLPVQDDTVFHVASVSKQLTVMAVLLLHEDGKLDIDDDIRAYIPDLVQFSEPVSIRQMIQNVSGIRDIWTLENMRGVRMDDTITMDDAIRIIARQKALNFAPGERYVYSNSNFVHLAVIAERVSGMTLQQHLKARVFDPLGMEQTVIRETYWQRIDKRAQSYHDNGDAYMYAVLNFGAYGATSLHTTAHDYMKWIDNYRQPRICKPETVALMLQRPTLADGSVSEYAGGLECGEIEGRPYYGHAGIDAAFRAYMMRLPEEDIDMCIFSNTQHTQPWQMGPRIARLLLGLPQVQLPDFSAPQPADPVGYYYADLPDAAAVHVYREGKTLYMRESYDPAPLTHVKDNCYKVGKRDEYLYLGETATMVTHDEVLKLRKADESPVENAEAYTGIYTSEELLTGYLVEIIDGNLFLKHFRYGCERLYPLGQHRYICGIMGLPMNLIVQFNIGDDGIAHGLNLSSERVFDVPFSKREA